MEAVYIIFGLVLAVLVLVGGLMGLEHLSNRLKKPDAKQHLDKGATLQLLADVTAEAHAQGSEAQRAMEELRELAPTLKQEDWELFEQSYRETLEAFSSETGSVQAQLEHLERVFRRDRIIGQARRELRDS